MANRINIQKKIVHDYYAVGREPGLKHYGTLGMRWGVRRYQPYGSGGYTPKGKEHFANAAGIFSRKNDVVKKQRAANAERDMTQTKKDAIKAVKDINKIGGTINCATCSMLYDLNRRGEGHYVSTANVQFAGDGNSLNYMFFYHNLKLRDYKTAKNTNTGSYSENFTNLCSHLNEQGAGARGVFCVKWDKSPVHHAMNYEVQKDGILFIDSQSGKIFDSNDKSTMDDLFNFVDPSFGVGTIRLDQCRPDYKYLDKYADSLNIKKVA